MICCCSAPCSSAVGLLLVLLHLLLLLLPLLLGIEHLSAWRCLKDREEKVSQRREQASCDRKTHLLQITHHGELPGSPSFLCRPLGGFFTSPLGSFSLVQSAIRTRPCRARAGDAQTGRDGQAAMSSDPRAAERRKRKGRPRQAEAGSEASRVQPIGGLFASSGQINEQSGFLLIAIICGRYLLAMCQRERSLAGAN